MIADFHPTEAIRDEILRRLAEPATADTVETARRRAALDERRRRLRDLYQLGDLDRDDYLTRRQAIDAELDGLAPGPAPDLDAARRVLDDFSLFWHEEPEPGAPPPAPPAPLRTGVDRRQARSRRAPKPAFAALFQEPAMCKEREGRDSNPRPPA